MIVCASPKTTVENKSALIGPRQKQKISLKMSFLRKMESKQCFLTFELNYQKMNKIRRSENDIWKQLNDRRAIAETKEISEKVAQYMTMSFICRITSNKRPYTLWIQLNFWLQNKNR